MIGSETYIYITTDGIKLTAKVATACDIKMEQNIQIKIDIKRIHLFDKETGKSILY